MNELHLFAGSGGGILGGILSGNTTVCAVEIEPYCRKVLLQRQRDGIFPKFPIWDDVRTFDGKPWRGLIDVVCGGFPCQDISAAGKGAGISGEKSGLWKEMFRIICEIRPKYAFMENSPMLTIRGLDVVLSDLAEAGYDAEWCVLGADDVGAPHCRKRIWMLATNMANSRCEHGSKGNSAGMGSEEEVRSFSSIHYQSSGERQGNNPNSNGSHGKGMQFTQRGIEERTDAIKPSWWEIEPAVGRMVDGVANRSNRLKAIGNGQVPLVAHIAWNYLMKGLK